MIDARPAAYDENAAYWIEMIRAGRDRYRTQLTNRAVLDAIAPTAGLRVVDAGCGEGWLSRACAALGAEVVGIDNCAAFIESCRESVNGLHPAPRFDLADMRALPMESGAVDVVVANHSLNDVDDPAAALAEFARVLRPGGRVVALMLHPCFYGGQAKRMTESLMPTPAEYWECPRVVSRPFLIDGETSPADAVVRLWPLEYWFAGLFNAGLVPVSVTEPHPTDEQMNGSDQWWRDNFRRPLFLLIEALKVA